MAKMIKFDLPIDGVKVATLDELRDHFTTEIIGHFRSGLLARWLRSRGLTRELAAVKALAAGDDATTFKELCRIFEIEVDDGAFAAALAEATGVPEIRPDQMLKKPFWNPGDTFQDCTGCPKLVVIPPGSFMMGSPEEEEGRDDNEGPVHEVRIDYPLAVGMYPVTFDEWDACVSDGGCGGYEPEDKDWGRGIRPVINVSWEDAQSYMRWLSRKTGKVYRLLSESEWEYAARAGTETPFHTGRTISTKQANYDGNFTYGTVAAVGASVAAAGGVLGAGVVGAPVAAAVGVLGTGVVGALGGILSGYRDGQEGQYREQMTTPVGSFEPNRFGLYDVHGNVCEWVEDCWNESYDGAPTDGSAWESEDCDCAQRLLRGGSWVSGPQLLRSAYRFRGSAGSRNDLIGFRVARSLRRRKISSLMKNRAKDEECVPRSGQSRR